LAYTTGLGYRPTCEIIWLCDYLIVSIIISHAVLTV